MVHLLGYEYKDDQLYLIGVEKDIAKLYPTKQDYKPYCLTQDPLLPRTGYIIGCENVELYDGLDHQTKWYKKVFVRTPTDVRKLRKRLKTKWAADVQFHLNYTKDNRLHYGCDHVVNSSGQLAYPFHSSDLNEHYKTMLDLPIPNVKRCALDIELRLDKTQKGLNIKRLDLPIVCASIVGSDGGNWVFLLGEQDSTFPTFHYYLNEKEMLNGILEILAEYPVVLTYGGDSFDFPYLLKRCKYLDIPHTFIWKQRALTLEGRLHLDLLPFFMSVVVQMRIFRKIYANATLGEVSRVLTGDPKIELKDLTDAPLVQIGLYCRNDAKLTLGLTTYDDNYVWCLLTTICRVSNLDMETVVRTEVSTWIKNYYRLVHHRRVQIVPSVEEMARYNPPDVDTYKGPMVLDPVKLNTVGVHFNVHLMDFSSLYPSCIVGKNISYDTVYCRHEECKSNLVPETDIWICNGVQGILTQMVNAMKTPRVEIFKPRSKTSYIAKAISEVLKIFTNATYGIFGSPEIKDLFCYPVPTAITAYGRASLLAAIEATKARGGVVLSGHTDSLFVKNLDEQQISSLSTEITERLGIEFEIQPMYRFVAFWRAANYFTVDMDGKVTPVGLMGRKTYIPRYVRERFEDLKVIIGSITDGTVLERKKGELIQLTRETGQRMKNGDIPLEELAYPVTIHKRLKDGHGQDYDVAKQAKDKVDSKVSAGDTLLKIKTIKERTGHTAMPIELVKSWDVVDKTKLLETLGTVFGQVLNPLGINVNHVLTGQEELRFNYS